MLLFGFSNIFPLGSESVFGHPRRITSESLFSMKIIIFEVQNLNEYNRTKDFSVAERSYIL